MRSLVLLMMAILLINVSYGSETNVFKSSMNVAQELVDGSKISEVSEGEILNHENCPLINNETTVLGDINGQGVAKGPVTKQL